MVFAKLWLAGILVAVLFVAATPPSSAPIILRNESRTAEPPPVVATEPCPDTSSTHVAAAEERMTSRIDATRKELQAVLSDTATSTASLAASTTALQERIAQLETRLAAAEAGAADQRAEARAIREAVAAPMAMTWILTALAGAGLLGSGYLIVRGLRARKSG